MSQYRWKPRVTVAAVVESDNRFLLVEESIDHRAVLNQPAGHLENGERIIDAVTRECVEETAWTFEPQHLVGVYRWRSARNGDTYLRFTFCGPRITHDPARALDDQIVAVHWLTWAEICARSDQLRSPLVLRSIEDYRRGQRFPLTLLHDVED